LVIYVNNDDGGNSSNSGSEGTSAQSISLHREPLMKNFYVSLQNLLFRSVVVQTALTATR